MDDQTIKEYQRFSEDSVNRSKDTKSLKANIEKDDNRIIVVTIQKLNNLMKRENNLAIYKEFVVFIFDEAHRSQFGEAQKNINKKFKKFCQFGFTGTPIFIENMYGLKTTESVFGKALHNYLITDAIRDDKVLKFKVDYHNVNPSFKSIEEKELELEAINLFESKDYFLHPERIKAVTTYILKKFNEKTRRNQLNSNIKFNAMFAVSSVDAAKLYYQSFKDLQINADKKIKVATIFSYVPNEAQLAIGDIADEDIEEMTNVLEFMDNKDPKAEQDFSVSTNSNSENFYTNSNLTKTNKIYDQVQKENESKASFEEIITTQTSGKEALQIAMKDYNEFFSSNFSIENLNDYYKDVAKRVKNLDVDLLLVVGMFLTGFDAPKLNTLFVDKNLRFHGLIQAFSRTNRIYDTTKPFGNIVTFRNLQNATIEAITLFGDKKEVNTILERSFKEYMEGFKDVIKNKTVRGFKEVVKELNRKFPDHLKIESEESKKEFSILFGEYLRHTNILKNYDEFDLIKEFQNIDPENPEEVENFKNKHQIKEEEIIQLKEMKLPSERDVQNYLSTYEEIRLELEKKQEADDKDKNKLDWSDVTFEIELLKSQEITLDYILELIYEKNKKNLTKEDLKEEATRLIRASLSNRPKETLLIEFINETNFDQILDKASLVDCFYKFAQIEKVKEKEELIKEENLNEEKAKIYIENSLKRGYATENGMELTESLPKMSPLKGDYIKNKERIFQKISNFVEKYKGIGDQKPGQNSF